MDYGFVWYLKFALGLCIGSVIGTLLAGLVIKALGI